MQSHELTRLSVASELGSWTHTEWRPVEGSALAWAVERVWDFEGWTSHLRERVFPNGALELIVHLGPHYRTVESGVAVVSPALCATGIQRGPMVIEAPDSPVLVLGIRLHPAAAWAVLREPLSGLVDRTVDLTAVVGGAAEELGERCHEAGSAEERVRRAVWWVEERVAVTAGGGRGVSIDAGVAWAEGQIRAASGAVSILELRERSGHSKAGFTSAFREQVGVTPKRYARIHRFQRALDWVHGSRASLAAIAARAGYYDQAHMNADFREFAGLTPTVFGRAERYPNSHSLAETPR